MKLKIVIFSILLLLFLISTKVCAADNNVLINLEKNNITVDGHEISKNKNDAVYLTNKTDNGGTSNKAIEANIEITHIINISKPGIYEFTGKIENCQISINANNIVGDIELILNNVDITCDNAPVIFIYRKDIKNSDCNVSINTKKGTNNILEGARLKVDIKDWENIAELVYNTESGRTSMKEFYERYKYNGAISSDVPLIFEGEGTLDILSKKKEAIECKQSITINSGIYIINAADDCINSCSKTDGAITINGGTIVANVLKKADEGDGLDSNGSIIINGGETYLFSYCEEENGYDTEYGMFINGGTLLSIGIRYEEITRDFNNKIIEESYEEKIPVGETIVVVDEAENAIFALKTDREIQNFIYSSDELVFNEYKIYIGEEIPKDLEYSLLDLTKVKKQEYREVDLTDLEYTTINNKNYIGIIIIIIFTTIIIILFVIAKNKIFKRKGITKK